MPVRPTQTASTFIPRYLNLNIPFNCFIKIEHNNRIIYTKNKLIYTYGDVTTKIPPKNPKIHDSESAYPTTKAAQRCSTANTIKIIENTILNFFIN